MPRSYANPDGTLEVPADSSLNLDGVDNRPICPVCQGYLENANSDYSYKRTNPDTRWFYCETCEGHLGYHRMRKSWKIDPYDLDSSQAFKEFFGVSEEN